jgi:hypothetical protein
VDSARLLLPVKARRQSGRNRSVEETALTRVAVLYYGCHLYALQTLTAASGKPAIDLDGKAMIRWTISTNSPS